MVDHRSNSMRDDPEAAQAEVIAFLGDAATHGETAVERIDTHISHIFIAGERTYKLKRAIRRNFLDYGTVEKRREACRREVEINRATAPGIYLGCRPITRSPRGLALGGYGKPVDWVVEMATFDRRLEFDRLAESGDLTERHVTDLADVVAAFHRSAPRAEGFGGAPAVGATIDQVAEAVGAASGTPELASAAADWRKSASAVLARFARRLDARRRHGCVRRCHGDLHLGNICLFDGRPTPFDAIEFNEAIASIDILYDLAFTAMDLLHRDERHLGNLLVNRYLAWTRDYGGLALMPLFMSMRAVVRAIPLASREEPASRAEAADLLQFANEMLKAPAQPLLVAIGGLSGSGKSTVARALAPQVGPGLGAVVLRSDVARKLMEGAAPEERLPPDAYTGAASRRVYVRMRRDAGRAVRAGAPVIMDATFLDAAERDAVRRLAARAGVPFAGLWLHGDPDRLAARLRERRGDASDATPELLADQERAGAATEWMQLEADAPLDEVVADACRAVGRAGGAAWD